MLKFSKAIASNTDLETSQAFILSRSLKNSSVVLAILASGEGENAFSIIRQASTEAIDNFFTSDEDTAGNLTQTFEDFKEATLGIEELQTLILSFKSGILYLLDSGSQKAYLLRNDELINLLPESSHNSQIISGYLEEGDKILLLNEALDHLLSTDEKSPLENLIKIPPDDLEDELNQLSLLQRNGPPLAAILIDNQKELQPEFEEENLPLETPPHTDLKIHISLVKNKKTRVFLAVVLILVLLGIFGFSKKHISDRAKNAQFQNFLSQAKTNFASAQTFKDSNPTSAKENFTSAQNFLKQALVLEPGDQAALNLKNQMDSQKDTILKVQEVENWPLFLDLNLIKSGFSTNRLSVSGNQMLLLDNNQKTLVEISLGQKTNNLLAGRQQLGDAQEVSLNGSIAFVYSKDKGVLSVDTTTQAVTVVAKPDSDWGNIADVSGFAGNFYLLDNLKNQIWKYTPIDSGFSDKSAYLNSGVVADFTDANRFLIDSSIWILKSNTEIDRFTAGSSDSFDVGGLDKNISSINSFFISSDTQNIYILDSPNSRIVVLQKSGQYVSQIIGDKFKDASDFIVDEQGKKIYLLENNKIYVIDLK